MKAVVVGEPKHFEKDGLPVVSASITVGNRSHEIWFRSSSGPLAKGSDAFLAVALALAMRVNMPLQARGAVSPRILAHTSTIQDILHSFDPSLARVSIQAEPRIAAEPMPAGGVACFFSAGVDSFYSVLKHRVEITHLILAHGFDFPIDNRRLRAKIAEGVHAAAAELRKPLIEVETNIRELADDYVDWHMIYHGAALASAAQMLSPLFHKAYIASSSSYKAQIPLGSHPLLDPLWSSEETEIVHDGCEFRRFEKMVQIVPCETVLRWLRVCWENRDEKYNCGQCDKCLRTKVALRSLGVLERCATFDHSLDLEAVSRLVPDHSLLSLTLSHLEDTHSDLALAEALRLCLGRAENPAEAKAGLLTDQLQQKDTEIANLRAVLAGYERGRVMRMLLTAEKLKKRVLGGLNAFAKGIRWNH